MKLKVVLALLFVMVGAGGYWFGKRNLPTSQDLAGMMVALSPDLEPGAIELVGCQLTQRVDRPAVDGKGFTRNVLTADLSLFELENVGLRPSQAGTIVYLAERKPVSTQLIDQAERLVRVVPAVIATEASTPSLSRGTRDDQTPRGDVAAMSRDKIREVFAMPEANLAFRLTSRATSDEGGQAGLPEPHPDAPRFHAFAESVMALDAPMSSQVSLLYRGPTAAPEQLLAGTVEVPKELVFTLRSEGSAKMLGAALYRYQVAHCRQR
ncbi:hypothetical protein [Marimonas arenosa]|uniref:Uncharacterized protein n=1 Tax=Marimonas arenosa TaxID=1795305 RepID=A0AAE4B2M5_9RHOB|nr:hypothetical protein [Marimonas arenosa]MDQ2088415.1 hypothetical protein [Marimonas arenosa]